MPLLRTIIEYNHVAVLGTTPVENFLAFNHCAHQLLSAHQEEFEFDCRKEKLNRQNGSYKGDPLQTNITNLRLSYFLSVA